MNKAMLSGYWDHFRNVHGITLRAIDALPKDKIDSHPVKEMRTPKELVSHMYLTMRAIAEGTAKGSFDLTEEMDAANVAKLKSHDDLMRYVNDSWKAADKAIQSLTDAQITGMVASPWGQSFPGFVCVNIIYDEHIHHRGQLYAYLRVFGVAPPMMWDFENNAPEYQQKQAAKV